MNSIAENVINSKFWEIIKRTDKGYILQAEKLKIRNFFVIPKDGESLKIKFDTLIYLIKRVADEKWLINRLIEIILNTRFIYGDTFKMSNVTPSTELFRKSLDGSNLRSSEVEDIILSNEMNDKLYKRCEDQADKCINEDLHTFDDIAKFNVKIENSVILYAHFNSADLTMLQDWDEVCNYNIDILKKSYTSLIKPIKRPIGNIFIRDTILLASAAAGSLDQLGKMHKISKNVINKKWYVDMDVFYKENFEEFKEYAMRDSLITLIHGLFMNDFSFKLGNMTNPNTLGSLATKYLRNK
ncbi:hypothetical protein HOY82DRAFT_544401 [Tuber indicum]|nr:hypothetical protein HOY82DRAFT_544401 [Tuber indicum]